VDVDHLQGREFFDHAAWSEARRKHVETSPQRDVEAVGEECDEYVRLDALLEASKYVLVKSYSSTSKRALNKSRQRAVRWSNTAC
jgi:hypothetical protein